MRKYGGYTARRRRELRQENRARARKNDLRSVLSLMVYIRPSNDKDVFTTFVNGKETRCEQIKFNFSKNKVFVSPQGAGGKQVEYDMPKEPFARVLDLLSIWLSIRPEDRVSCTYAVLGEGDPGIALYNIKRVGDFLIKVDK